jgi:hypothetical protein
VQILAWRVVERKERGGRRYWQDLACIGSGLLFSFFISEILYNSGAGVVLGVVLVNWLGMGAGF